MSTATLPPLAPPRGRPPGQAAPGPDPDAGVIARYLAARAGDRRAPEYRAALADFRVLVHGRGRSLAAGGWVWTFDVLGDLVPATPGGARPKSRPPAPADPAAGAGVRRAHWHGPRLAGVTDGPECWGEDAP